MCHIGDISINNAKYDKIFINLLMAFCEALMVLFGPNDHQHGSWNQMRSSRTRTGQQPQTAFLLSMLPNILSYPFTLPLVSNL